MTTYMVFDYILNMNYEEIIDVLFASRSYIYFITSLIYCYVTMNNMSNKIKNLQKQIDELKSDLVDISQATEYMLPTINKIVKAETVERELLSTSNYEDGPAYNTRSKTALKNANVSDSTTDE